MAIVCPSHVSFSQKLPFRSPVSFSVSALPPPETVSFSLSFFSSGVSVSSQDSGPLPCCRPQSDILPSISFPFDLTVSSSSSSSSRYPFLLPFELQPDNLFILLLMARLAKSIDS